MFQTTNQLVYHPDKFCCLGSSEVTCQCRWQGMRLQVPTTLERPNSQPQFPPRWPVHSPCPSYVKVVFSCRISSYFILVEQCWTLENSKTWTFLGMRLVVNSYRHISISPAIHHSSCLCGFIFVLVDLQRHQIGFLVPRSPSCWFSSHLHSGLSKMLGTPEKKNCLLYHHFPSSNHSNHSKCNKLVVYLISE